MNFYALGIVAIGLSMDAVAVSICKGLTINHVQWRNALKLGLSFGLCQGLMTLIGFAVGSQFSDLIGAIDHWVAFGVLSLLGINMLRSAFNQQEDCHETKLDCKQVLLLSLATSIDALSVGVSFAFLEIEILSAILLIAGATMLLSTFAFKGGQLFGRRLKNKAELLGGVILLAIAIQILYEHGVFSR